MPETDAAIEARSPQEDTDRNGAEPRTAPDCLQPTLVPHTRCIAPDYQSRGIGSYMTRWLVSEARASGRGIVLSVLKVNERARRLYERLGFVIVNESLHHHRMQLR